MNVIDQARDAYSPANAPTRSARSTEYLVFSQITSRLQNALALGSFNAIAEALHENRRLWTILAADVADNENRLPRALRAQIFYLAEFTRQHTSKVLRGDAEVTPLIDINTAIMQGLAGHGTAG